MKQEILEKIKLTIESITLAKSEGFGEKRKEAVINDLSEEAWVRFRELIYFVKQKTDAAESTF